MDRVVMIKKIGGFGSPVVIRNLWWNLSKLTRWIQWHEGKGTPNPKDIRGMKWKERCIWIVVYFDKEGLNEKIMNTICTTNNIEYDLGNDTLACVKVDGKTSNKLSIIMTKKGGGAVRFNYDGARKGDNRLCFNFKQRTKCFELLFSQMKNNKVSIQYEFFELLLATVRNDEGKINKFLLLPKN